MSEIIFYDIPGKAEETLAWSPNTWNTRFALNFKGLKYKTEWVEYPDIDALCKKIGAKHTSFKADGATPHYTLPVIYDPSTKAVVSDSTAIADYLDKTYPDQPLLYPPGTRALHAAFENLFSSVVGVPLYPLLVFHTSLNLNKPSYDYFRKTREEAFGKKLEHIAPEGESEEMWKKFEDGLALVAGWLKEAGDKPFIGGDQPSYADLQVGGRLIWAKLVWGENSSGWNRIKALDGGMWGRYLQQLDKYTTVV